MDRPVRQLKEVLRAYPDLSKLVNLFRAGKGKGLPKWHDFCFLPIAGWQSIVAIKRSNGAPLSSYEQFQEAQLLSALGTWRYSQGVYRFDEDIYQSVINSEIKGNLPSEILHRLPEWCLYVETPHMEALNLNIHGFYAHLEHDINGGGSELRILIDSDGEKVCIPLHLGNWSVYEGVKRYFDEAEACCEAKLGRDEKTEREIAKHIMPILSLILFICSDEPDITSLDNPNSSPAHPKAKNTKKGWRIFPAEKAKLWSVGNSLGERIRKEALEYQSESGRTVKPHLRRGHYHTYWTGKRGSDEQKPVLKWIMPTIINGGV